MPAELDRVAKLAVLGDFGQEVGTGEPAERAVHCSIDQEIDRSRDHEHQALAALASRLAPGSPTFRYS